LTNEKKLFIADLSLPLFAPVLSKLVSSDGMQPFTAVQTNLSATSHWTVGPTYYTTLAMAEVFGSTNTSQVVDISVSLCTLPSFARELNDLDSKNASAC